MKLSAPSAVMLLLGVSSGAFAPTRDSTSGSTFPAYTANVPSAADNTAAAAFASTTTGGYKCVRSGLIFAHSQKIDITNNAGAPVTDANLRTFYGTTSAHIGLLTTPYDFGCCKVLDYTPTTTTCSAAVDITTTTATNYQGNVY